MKIRTGFVSNSSSSSFVVIDATKGYCDKLKMPYQFQDSTTLVVDSNLGETQFGWGQEVLTDVGSRINFAFIQTEFGENKGRLAMLELVIIKNSKIREIIWNITDGYNSPDGKDYGYIDHQSSFGEGRNLEIFDSEQTLKDFIFGVDSKIVLDNDNH